MTEKTLKTKVVLLKDGTMHGAKGDVVELSHADAAQMCSVREKDHGEGKISQYRLAKPADEKSPPISMENLTKGECAELGIRNIVATPPGDILPAGMRKTKASEEATIEGETPVKPKKRKKKGKGKLNAAKTAVQEAEPEEEDADDAGEDDSEDGEEELSDPPTQQ